MRSLRRLGYTVTFVAANDLSAESAAIAALEQQGFSVCHAPYYGSVEEVLRLRNICFDAVYLNRVSNAAKYMALARCHCPKALILYGVADLHYLRLERQAAVEERPELLARSRRIRLVESTCAWSADAVLTHSAFEAGLLRQAIRDANVHVLPWDVPVRLVQAEASARTGVAFIGGYAHHPNVDAARYLAEAVMPMVWRQDSTIGCTLAGSDMPPEIADLAGPRLTVLGQVHDVYTVLNRARLTVAPLRYGAGVKGKVLASLAAGVPCVMTSVAAEGIGLPDALQALVRDDAAGLAEAILQLHEDVPRCLEAAKAGVAFVAEHFTEEIVDVALTHALGGRVGTSTQLHLAAAE
jgi:glycosyltransferase involved in cell wall biosynthesis